MKEIKEKAAEWLKNRAKDPERKPFTKELEAFDAFMSELMFDVLRSPFREAWLQQQKEAAEASKLIAPVPDDIPRVLPEGT